MRMARRRAVGNHGYRQRRGVGRVVLDFDIEHRGQPAQPLSADPSAISGIHDLKA